jgi:hypothetical protein
MTTPIITIHNVTTDKIETREMNNQEVAQLAADKVAEDAIKAAQVQALVAKATAETKLAALGLTTDDLKALGLGGN